MEFLKEIKNAFLLLSNSEKLICVIIFLILLLVILKKYLSKFYNKILGRIEKYIIPLADQAVLYSAKYLNSETGQAKMDAAVLFVKEHSKSLPWYIKIFLSNFNKKWLVDKIEDCYQAYKSNMENSTITDKDIDIKGNEVKTKTKIEVKKK